MSPRVPRAGASTGSARTEAGGGDERSSPGKATALPSPLAEGGRGEQVLSRWVSAQRRIPISPSIAYVGTAYGVFKSTDGGDHWTPTGLNAVGTSVGTLALAPSAPSTLYVGTGYAPGTVQLLKSVDGGATWSALLSLSSPIQAIAVAPDSPDHVLVGTGEGLITGTPENNWTTTATGLASLYVSAFVAAPSSPQTLYAGASGLVAAPGGIFVSSDAGATWRIASPPIDPNIVFQVLALAVDANVPDTVYASVSGSGASGTFKTTDEGSSWQATGLGYPASGLTVDPATSNIVYAWGPSGIAKSVNGGSSWSTINPSYVSDFSVGTPDSARLYAVTFGGSLYRSEDSGLHWKLLPGAFRSAPVSSGADGKLLVAASASSDVLTSTDGGDSWTPTSEDSNMRGAVVALSVVPSDPPVIIARTDSAVFLSGDGSTTWTRADDGLPGAPLLVLGVVQAASARAYASILGHSLFELPMALSTTTSSTTSTTSPTTSSTSSTTTSTTNPTTASTTTSSTTSSLASSTTSSSTTTPEGPPSTTSTTVPENVAVGAVVSPETAGQPQILVTCILPRPGRGGLCEAVGFGTATRLGGTVAGPSTPTGVQITRRGKKKFNKYGVAAFSLRLNRTGRRFVKQLHALDATIEVEFNAPTGATGQRTFLIHLGAG